MSTAATLTGLAATGILVVAISPPAAGGEGADIPNPIRTCWETPVFAHRGDTHRYTENTREAVASGFRLGAAVEVDVRTAADGTLLLMHDRRVNRTTNGRGRVEDKTWPQLRRYRTRTVCGSPG